MNNTRKDAISAQINALAAENQAFVADLVTADSPAAVQAALKKYDIDVTIPEVEEMYADGVKVMNDFLDSADAELGEGELENVAGGRFFQGSFNLVTDKIAACGFATFCSSNHSVCPAEPATTRSVSLRAGLRTARRGC